jgi:hypothetical protein
VENLWKTSIFCGKPVEKIPDLLTGIYTLWKSGRVFHIFSTGGQRDQSQTPSRFPDRFPQFPQPLLLLDLFFYKRLFDPDPV